MDVESGGQMILDVVGARPVLRFKLAQEATDEDGVRSSTPTTGRFQSQCHWRAWRKTLDFMNFYLEYNESSVIPSWLSWLIIWKGRGSQYWTPPNHRSPVKAASDPRKVPQSRPIPTVLMKMTIIITGPSPKQHFTASSSSSPVWWLNWK